MTLTLQTLYFEDLSVGMTEHLAKTVASSDVVGFAEVTGDRNPIHLFRNTSPPRRLSARASRMSLYTASLISARCSARGCRGRARSIFRRP